ncbi:SLC13 family permease [soil metagenome]
MEIPPLAILAVGILTVVGMILILKLNAFIALITSAILVSLLAPGDLATKISRVALGFGGTAGDIGIVIALAAVIGACMMDSGAADRIVRAFLKLLGEKRASVALMGSGFVLAVPVFFDTVFYLLVPLGRSLYRRTGVHYLKYVLAIACGGAITHTLVPPTPGPLLMASILGIDLGLMILVGLVVALPSAIAGLVFSAWIDRRMDVPMRPVPGMKEEPPSDANLPPLWLAVLPVVLPVALISANTVLGTWANTEHAARLSVEDVADWPGLVSPLVLADEEAVGGEGIPVQQPAALIRELRQAEESGAVDAESTALAAEALTPLIAAQIRNRLPAELVEALTAADARQAEIDPDLKARLVEALNVQVLADRDFAGSDLSRKSESEVERAGRLVLEALYPAEVLSRHQWQTPRRQAADIAALLGDANLALLLATVVAILILVRQRRPSRENLAKMVEVSLMSGGIIILITSAGGAFGKMLVAAQVGPAIEGYFETSGGNGSGLALMLLGFGVAAVLKVAQGSSTVAMITAAGMLVAMVPSSAVLGYNPVYLATAIGSGSLMGSWMNDSGFWVFAKMSGLTEAETLKSWTPLLLVLGTVGLLGSMTLAFVLPLV